jgi:phosphomannomutase/phosphoglucomutase
MMEPNPLIFRAYDIRGRAGPDLNETVAEVVGQAFGTLISANGSNKVAVGSDNRLSSPSLTAAIIRGLISSGCQVLDIGLATSPLLYFTVAHDRLAGGISITGSHNPPEENGFKLIGPGGIPLSSDEIQEVRRRIERSDFSVGRGAVEEYDAGEPYLSFITDYVLGKNGPVLPKTKIVVDGGNGVASLFAPKLLRSLGAEVIEQYCDLDGRFPNRGLDPADERNLAPVADRVLAVGADFGFAFDGDGDRLGMVDEAGTRYPAEYVVILLARDFLSRHPGQRVLFDVRASQIVEMDIASHGGIPYMYKTGHSLIKREMRDRGIGFAGEASGHMFFGEDYFGIDDALIAAGKVASIVSNSRATVREHFADLPRFASSPEFQIPADDASKFDIARRVGDYFRSRYQTVDIDGARVKFEQGWALIRASNTNPVLILRCEARDEVALSSILSELSPVLSNYLSDGALAPLREYEQQLRSSQAGDR